MASRISALLEPDPPWKTSSAGKSSSVLCFSLMNAWCLPRKAGDSFTLPGLYTPCTLPNEAAMVKFFDTLDSAVYTRSTSSGWEYSFSMATSSLLTPSSSPPVMPSSISSKQLILSMRSRYLMHSSMFSSRSSSDRSICHAIQHAKESGEGREKHTTTT